MKILRKNQKQMLAMKNTVREIKNPFNILFSRQDIAEERISELENILIEYLQPKSKKTEKKIKTRIYKNCGIKDTVYISWEYQKKKKGKGQKKYLK